jgi:hypothetical protein
MTIDPNEVSGAVLDLARDLCGRGAADADVGCAMLRISIVTFYRHVRRERESQGFGSLPKIGPKQVNAIVLEAMELIGEAIDDAEADQAERN